MIKTLFKSENGVSLIEVILGIFLLGMIAAVFVSGMFTIVNTSFRNSRQAHALALAQSQMEYIKQQGYNTDNSTDSTNVCKYLITDNITTGYTVYGWIDEPISVEGKRTFAQFWNIPADSGDEGTSANLTDTGLQKICVRIIHQSDPDPVITLYGFKVNHEFIPQTPK